MPALREEQRPDTDATITDLRCAVISVAFVLAIVTAAVPKHVLPHERPGLGNERPDPSGRMLAFCPNPR